MLVYHAMRREMHDGLMLTSYQYLRGKPYLPGPALSCHAYDAACSRRAVVTAPHIC